MAPSSKLLGHTHKASILPRLRFHLLVLYIPLPIEIDRYALITGGRYDVGQSIPLRESLKVSYQLGVVVDSTPRTRPGTYVSHFTLDDSVGNNLRTVGLQ